MSSRDVEIAAVVLAPHFDAVRDEFCRFSPETGVVLERLRDTQMLVDPSIRNSDRHYAACRDDGLQIVAAPQIVTDIDVEQLIAITCHEFGHAADMAYPGDWTLLHPGQKTQRALWIGGRTDKSSRHWKEWLWHERSRDIIEWTADAIAELVIGRPIHYCGQCVLQCFTSGPKRELKSDRRPAGLR